MPLAMGAVASDDLDLEVGREQRQAHRLAVRTVDLVAQLSGVALGLGLEASSHGRLVLLVPTVVGADGVVCEQRCLEILEEVPELACCGWGEGLGHPQV